MTNETGALIGTIDVVLDHAKLHKLTEVMAKSVAIEFAAAFESEINKWAEENEFPFRAHLEVKDATSGCVKAKLKVFLTLLKSGTAVAAFAATTVYGAVVKYPDFRDILHAVAKRTAETHGCKLGNESFACYGAIHTIRLTEEIYVTHEGETFADVCERVWKVPKSSQSRYFRAVVDTQPDVFLDVKSGKLRERKILFRPAEEQLRQIPGK